MSEIDDYHLSAQAFRALEALGRPDRQRALRALRLLLRSPEPNGVVKRKLPFPYRPGTRGADINGFHIVYSVHGNLLKVYDVIVGGSLTAE